MACFLTRIAQIFSLNEEIYHLRDVLAGLDGDEWIRDTSQLEKDVFCSFMGQQLQQQKQYTKKELVELVAAGMGLALDAQRRQDLEQEEYQFGKSALQKASFMSVDFRSPARIMVSAALERSASMHIGQKRIATGRFLGKERSVDISMHHNVQPS